MGEPVVGRDESLALLREHMPVLRERFGVQGLTLFGSTARNEATADSDVDILVQQLDCPSTWGRYEVEDYLEALFGRRIDLVLRHRMRREYMPWVEADEVDPMNPRPYMPDANRPKRWDVHVQEMTYRCERVRAFSARLTYDDYNVAGSLLVAAITHPSTTAAIVQDVIGFVADAYESSGQNCVDSHWNLLGSDCQQRVLVAQ